MAGVSKNSPGCFHRKRVGWATPKDKVRGKKYKIKRRKVNVEKM